MLVAAFGDIHDRLDNLDRVLPAIQECGPDLVVVLGDLSQPPVLVRIAAAFPQTEIHLVYGNLDDADELKRTIDREKLLQVYFHQLQGRLTFDQKKLAFTHKPRDAESLLNQGFDVVFFGHTHESRVTDHDGTLLVNPGDVQGRFGRPPSFALYDTEKGTARIIPVDTET